MKITSVHIHAITLPLVRPFIVAYASYNEMPSIIVKVETDQGLVGYGESVPDQHVTGETWESTYAMLVHSLAPAIIGENPFALERIHHLLDQCVYKAPAAKAAIDLACYDLMGKATGQPVYQLLGGKYHSVLTLPYVLSILQPETMAAEAKQAVADGFDSIKIKVGSDLATDIERIRAVREAVGPDIRLRVDANQGWENRTNTLTALKQVEDCRIDWMEQPVVAHDLDALADIRRQTSIPIMVDEGVLGASEMREVIAKKAADKVNIKLMKCGGIYPAAKLVHQAEMAGMECQIGSMPESSIGSAAGAHLSIAKKNIVSNELAGPFIFAKDVANLTCQGNQILLSDKPGFGVELDEAVLTQLTVRQETVS
ncbi:mandelate racemase/muconate lactonizing enzyme family protein [Brevibacillus sp. HD1.4A]|uniref:mandelate racemase/muconate lactonizing enzyme family protein n=1 Tax=Brevibacillus sp. HD1.4A TaxID=2738978 RepID=UPI00156BC378|nr:dipeptide epimerase [Brevibacillus sp. HD1.4A]NRQ55020.1 dipeptide epimerase [Brevibacillus sp. HD1.4A]